MKRNNFILALVLFSFLYGVKGRSLKEQSDIKVIVRDNYFDGMDLWSNNEFDNVGEARTDETTEETTVESTTEAPTEPVTTPGPTVTTPEPPGPTVTTPEPPGPTVTTPEPPGPTVTTPEPPVTTPPPIATTLEPDYSAEQSMYLDPDHKYEFKWHVDKANQEIYGTLTVEAQGWVGFGIGEEDGQMLNADIFMGGYNDDTDATYFGDFYTLNQKFPIQDTVNNWMDVEANVHETHTIISFRRKFQTGDPNSGHDKDIEFEDKEAITTILWSYNVDNDNMTAQHTKSGSEKILLGREPDTGAASALIPTFSTLILIFIGLMYSR